MKNLVVAILTSAVTASLCVYYLPFTNRVGSTAIVLPEPAVETPTVARVVKSEPSSNSEALRQKVAELEAMQQSLQVKVAALNDLALPAGLSGSRPSEAVNLDKIKEEEERRLAEQNHEQGFERLKANFYSEGRDYAWAAEMSDSFSEVENRLLDFNIDSIQITDKECRSETCIVEYTYTDDELMHKVRPLLTARHVSEVTFKEIEEDGVKKTIAIYRR